jgi:hypothetical protein
MHPVSRMKNGKREEISKSNLTDGSCSYLLVYYTARHPACFSQEPEDMTNP